MKPHVSVFDAVMETDNDFEDITPPRVKRSASPGQDGQASSHRLRASADTPRGNDADQHIATCTEVLPVCSIAPAVVASSAASSANYVTAGVGAVVQPCAGPDWNSLAAVISKQSEGIEAAIMIASQTAASMQSFLAAFNQGARNANIDASRAGEAGNVGAPVGRESAAPGLHEPAQPVATGPVHPLLGVQVDGMGVPVPIAEQAKKLDQKILDHLKKVARKFESNVQAFFRAKDAVDNCQAAVDTLKLDGLQYPSGTRPFRSPVEAVELDACWSVASQQEFVWSVNIPKDTTRRQAMNLLHHAVVAQSKSIELESKLELLETKRALISRGKYYAAISEMENVAVDDLGLENGSVFDQLNSKLAFKKADELYNTVVVKVRNARHEKKEKISKDAKAKEEVNEKLANGKPEVFLDAYVEAKIEAKLKRTNAEEGSDAEAVTVDASKVCQALAAPLNKPSEVASSSSKNGVSQGAAPGKNKQEKVGEGKNKGKGKGKNKSNAVGRMSQEQKTWGGGHQSWNWWKYPSHAGGSTKGWKQADRDGKRGNKKGEGKHGQKRSSWAKNWYN